MKILAAAVAAWLALPSDALASCPSSKDALEAVQRVLAFDDATRTVDAYRKLADAWLCEHPDATAAEFAAWVRAVPTAAAASMSREMPVHLAEQDRVMVVWRRSDIDDGGAAVVYARENGGWREGDALDVNGRPEIVGVLGEHVAVAEIHSSARVDTLDLRVIRLRDRRLTQTQRFDDLRGAQVDSSSSKVLKVRFHRAPAYLVDGTTPPLDYELTMRADGSGPKATIKPLTPALDALQTYCVAADDRDRRAVVIGSRLLSRMPDCDAMTVVAQDPAPRGAFHLTIEARLVCIRDGDLVPLRRATLSVAPTRKGRYRITNITADKCDAVRARKKDEAL